MACVRKTKKHLGKKTKKVQRGGFPKLGKFGFHMPKFGKSKKAKHHPNNHPKNHPNNPNNVLKVAEFMAGKSKSTGRQHNTFFNNSGIAKAGISPEIEQHYNKLSPAGRVEAFKKAMKAKLITHFVENRTRLERFNNNGNLIKNSKGLQSEYAGIYSKLTPEERKEVIMRAMYNERSRPKPKNN